VVGAGGCESLWWWCGAVCVWVVCLEPFLFSGLFDFLSAFALSFLLRALQPK
jgi:hypothetical protein